MKRIFRRGFIFLISLAILSTVGLFVWISPLFHISDGSVTIPGLRAPVELVRDQHGVPHIKAENLLDAYSALGFMHARDRFWQMEATRRLGAGQLAEVVGKSAVQSDMMMRTLGLKKRAKQQYKQLATPVQKSLQAYARGVNAWLNTHHGALSPEFTLFGLEPAPWQPVDSLVWGKLMGMRLTRNWRRELLRYQLLQKLPLKKIRDLWPTFPAGDPVSIRKSLNGVHDFLDQSFAFLDELISPFSEASNAWAIAGKHTDTGKPILANDPHLGFSIPILWYLARIETPNQHLIGASVPSLPFHVLGQNKDIAWGLSTTSGDTSDVFIDLIDPKDSSRYITPTGTAPFTTRMETILVSGSNPIFHKVRETRHGPVISDLIFGPMRNPARVLSLKATFLTSDDKTPEAMYRLNQAKDWKSFLAAMKHFHAPQQNVMYADRHGNIGLIAAGRMPIRRHGQGWLPQAGWHDEYDWKKFIPFNELPKAFNPPEGILVNANNRIIDRNFPYDLSEDFAPGYRAKRITDELKRIKRQSVKSSARLQMDEVSVMAQEILPLMLDKLSLSSVSKSLQATIQKLKTWNGKMDADRSEPLIFNAWLRELIRVIAEDELGNFFKRFWYVRPHFVRLVLTEKNDWCDNIKTKNKTETCRESVTTAFKSSIKQLKARFGNKIESWRWGDAHRIQFNHIIFSKIPLIGSLFNHSVETGGGQFTPNKGAYRYRDEDRLFENRHGAGYRAVYDLADSKKSTFMIATGQSGNPLSPYYDHFIVLWKRGESIFLDIPQESLKKSNQNMIKFLP